jgi:hypothetical protein
MNKDNFDEIKYLRRLLVEDLKEENYHSAGERCDKLSLLYFWDVINYSKEIEAEKNKKVKKSLAEELEALMCIWRIEIRRREKWGKQKTNLERPCNRTYRPEEFYLKLKEAS